jgi:predicted DCC family thiol-disulfide oxidoreductase YuxK
MNKDGASDVKWNDVHKNNELVSEVNADLEFVRERLHVVDEDNHLQVGFDAILAIWRNSPKETWKSKILGLPGIKHLGRAAYNVFAAGLYKWNRSKKHW